ncbi:MAG: histidinol-phosphate transaminase [Pseudomonadota bacterium]
MTHSIAPQPGLLNIKAYVPGEAHLHGANKVMKLSSNENPLGPSPRAVEAFRAASESLNIYPDGAHAALRHAIGDIHGVDPARVICGNGSGDVLNLLAQAYAGAGDEVITTEHGFSMYPIYAHGAGATLVTVPEADRVVNVDHILAACTERTKIVYVANPANPTGTFVPLPELERLADGLPRGAILALDGAYAEFVPDYDAGLALVEARQNVFMSRTFSKAYGLGGLRIGWGYGPAEMIDMLQRIRGPFNVSAAGLAAAEAAVRDVDYTEHCIVQNEVWRDWMVKELRRMGLETDASLANFVTPRFASEAAVTAADEALRARGILVRRVGGYGLPTALRITVGTEAECRAVIDTLKAHIQ